MVILPMRVNGALIAGLLYSGSSVMIKSLSLAETLGVATVPSDKKIISMTGHAEVASKKGEIELKLAGQTRRTTMHFVADEIWRDTPYDVIVGCDTMERFPTYTVSSANREFSFGQNHIEFKTKAELAEDERNDDRRCAYCGRRGHEARHCW
jgi:hypothetical protein